MRVALLLFVAACGGQLSYTPTNKTPHPLHKRDASEVELFSVAPGDRPFIDIGFFELDDPNLDPGSSTSQAALSRLRTEGGKIGCEGVVVDAPSHISNGLASTNRYRAVCLVFQ